MPLQTEAATANGPEKEIIAQPCLYMIWPAKYIWPCFGRLCIVPRLECTGQNYVAMDMNSLVWVACNKTILGARYSATATLPFAKNDLTSDVQGNISGGAGFADSYYMPLILGWSGDRFGACAIHGFLAPTGRYVAGGTDNVGSGYWTHALSSGQTVYLTKDKKLTFSAFEMYEFHTTQEGTPTHPGDTFDLDYSLLTPIPNTNSRIQFGLAGYEARQVPAHTVFR
jgi:hypothetical protein